MFRKQPFQISYVLYHKANSIQPHNFVTLQKYINEINFRSKEYDYISLELSIQNAPYTYLKSPLLKMDNYEDIQRFVNQSRDDLFSIKK